MAAWEWAPPEVPGVLKPRSSPACCARPSTRPGEQEEEQSRGTFAADQKQGLCGSLPLSPGPTSCSPGVHGEGDFEEVR